jgi:hypothetical protein
MTGMLDLGKISPSFRPWLMRYKKMQHRAKRSVIPMKRAARMKICQPFISGFQVMGMIKLFSYNWEII